MEFIDLMVDIVIFSVLVVGGWWLVAGKMAALERFLGDTYHRLSATDDLFISCTTYFFEERVAIFFAVHILKN